MGKTFLSGALGYQAIKMGYTVLYRSIFDLVREFMKDQTFAGEERTRARYLKTDFSETSYRPYLYPPATILENAF